MTLVSIPRFASMSLWNEAGKQKRQGQTSTTRLAWSIHQRNRDNPGVPPLLLTYRSGNHISAGNLVEAGDHLWVLGNFLDDFLRVLGHKQHDIVAAELCASPFRLGTALTIDACKIRHSSAMRHRRRHTST